MIDVKSAKIVKLHEARLARQREFQANNGIICPIYGIRKEVQIQGKDSLKSIMEKMNKTINKMSLKEDDLDSRFSEMKSKSTILGYVAAYRPGYEEWVKSGSKPDYYPAIRFGWSFCRQEDLFNKDIGMLRAMTCPYVLDIQSKNYGGYYIGAERSDEFYEDNVELFQPFSFDMLPKSYFNSFDIKFHKSGDAFNGDTIRVKEMACVDYYPITINKQFKRFFKKCKKYFLKAGQTQEIRNK